MNPGRFTTHGYTAVELRPTMGDNGQAIMRGQTVIRAAWLPLLAGALAALYAPSTPVFVAAVLVFLASAGLQAFTAIRVVRLSHRRHLG